MINLFALSQILDISLPTLFLSHSTPHFMRDSPYLAHFWAIHTTAGATTLEMIGHHTAPVIPHIVAHDTISPIVASPHSFTIGSTPPIQAHTSPVRHAIDGIPLAHARYWPHIGAVNASCHPIFLISICFCVKGFVHPFVIHAIVISSPTCFAHSPNLFAPSLHFSANSSAHNISAHPAMSGHVIFWVVKSRTFPAIAGICSHALKAQIQNSFAHQKNHKSSHSGISFAFSCACFASSSIPSTFIPLFWNLVKTSLKSIPSSSASAFISSALMPRSWKNEFISQIACVLCCACCIGSIIGLAILVATSLTCETAGCIASMFWFTRSVQISVTGFNFFFIPCFAVSNDCRACGVSRFLISIIIGV